MAGFVGKTLVSKMWIQKICPSPTPRVRSLGLAGRSLSVCVRTKDVAARLEVSERRLEVSERRLEVSEPRLELSEPRLEVSERRFEVGLGANVLGERVKSASEWGAETERGCAF